MTATKIFIPVWLAAALVIMWIGVPGGIQRHRGVAHLLVIFAIPAAAAAFVWWKFS